MVIKLLLLSICFISISNWILAQDTTKIDWQEFYPLHLGDFWKYFENYGDIPLTYTKKIVDKDTMSNRQIYAKMLCIFHGFGSPGYEYQRVDCLGDVYKYDQYEKKEYLLFKLNVCIGDIWPDSLMGYWRVENKYDEIVDEDTITHIDYFWYGSILHGEYHLIEGIGVTYFGFEGGYRYLVGACINGIVYGDTMMTHVQQNKKEFQPQTIILHQNFPNPFNATTEIRYQLPEACQVRLVIYTLLGQQVSTVVDQSQPAGDHTMSWDGKDATGQDLASGIYVYQINAGSFVASKKMVLIR